jgi:ribosomal protein S18 acetylase RimI-like enzyme
MVSDTPANTVVWADDGATETSADGLVGFAIVSQFNNLHHAFRPRALTPAVEREMMDWAVERRRQRGSPDGTPMTLDAAAREDDAATRAFLRRHGFTPTGDTTIHMVRALADTVAEARPPTSYTLRPLAGKDEVPAYVAAHQAAYGTQKMTAATRLAIMRSDSYRPSADLVAVTPDGTVASFCVCLVDADANTRWGQSAGEIAIVGTRPDHQRRGLARAMIFAGLHALRDLGLATATLTTSGANVGAIQLYESLGLRQDYAIAWYSCPVA